MGTTRDAKERAAIGNMAKDCRRGEEMREMGRTWNESGWLAQDRNGWRRLVGAFCSTGSEED